MVLDPIPQPLPVHFFGSRPQPPTSRPEVIFHKRATNYRARWRKMTYGAKASYASSPPCNGTDLWSHCDVTICITRQHTSDKRTFCLIVMSLFASLWFHCEFTIGQTSMKYTIIVISLWVHHRTDFCLSVISLPRILLRNNLLGVVRVQIVSHSKPSHTF